MSSAGRCSVFDFAVVRHASQKVGWVLGILLLSLVLGDCHTSKPEPTSLNYLRLGWSQPDDLPGTEPLALQFTRETGIRVRDLPVPETTRDQLALSRRLVKPVGSGTDVLNIDVIWPGVLEPDLVDLRYDY